MQFFKGNADPKPAAVKKEAPKDNSIEALDIGMVPEAYKAEAERAAKEKGGESASLSQNAARVLSPDKKTVVSYIMTFSYTKKDSNGKDEPVEVFIVVKETKGKLESRLFTFPTFGTPALENPAKPRARRHA